MESFTPPGGTYPDTDPGTALTVLKDRLGIDFAAPYADATDRRHEIAVLAVDLGRRLTDLNRLVFAMADLDMVKLTRLRDASSDGRADLSTLELPTPLPVSATAMQASEVDRALRLVAAAYRQAWWSDSEAGPAGWQAPAGT